MNNTYENAGTVLIADDEPEIRNVLTRYSRGTVIILSLPPPVSKP